MSEAPEIVIKAFVVREEIKDAKGNVKLKDVSRRFHAISAAEDFKALAEKTARAAGNNNRFIVGNVVGVE